MQEKRQKHLELNGESTASPISDEYSSVELQDDETRVGLFAVRLQELSLKIFMLLRKLVPRKEYILIKNRISARHNRTRKKDLLNDLKHRNSKLLNENKRLKRLITE